MKAVRVSASATVDGMMAKETYRLARWAVRCVSDWRCAGSAGNEGCMCAGAPPVREFEVILQLN